MANVVVPRWLEDIATHKRTVAHFIEGDTPTTMEAGQQVVLMSDASFWQRSHDEWPVGPFVLIDGRDAADAAVNTKRDVELNIAYCVEAVISTIERVHLADVLDADLALLNATRQEYTERWNALNKDHPVEANPQVVRIEWAYNTPAPMWSMAV